MTLLMIGTTELLLIGGVALLLFGGKKLPEMMRGLGQGVKEFKQGMNDVTNNVENETPNKGESAKEVHSEDSSNQENMKDGE